jgi:putative endonuclease
MENKKITRHDLGQKGEDIALRFLKKKRYKIAATRYRQYRGEIDIIAYDKKTLVFVEVKTRSDISFGSPEESVNSSKQNQIKKIAQGYLSIHNQKDMECRFDVISIQYNSNKEYTIHHIKTAF